MQTEYMCIGAIGIFWGQHPFSLRLLHKVVITIPIFVKIMIIIVALMIIIVATIILIVFALTISNIVRWCCADFFAGEGAVEKAQSVVCGQLPYHFLNFLTHIRDSRIFAP